MKRLFWAMLGIGVGAVVGIQVSRWAGRTKQRYSPQGIARSASGVAGNLGERIREAVHAGAEEMVQREAELRAELGLPR